MATCFCGCGREIKGMRLVAANKVADRMRTDLALFRGGIDDRLIAPAEVAEVSAMVDEGTGRLEWLTAYLHGGASRRDMDKAGITGWVARAADPRKAVMVGATRLGFHGGGLRLAELLYGGHRAPGIVVALRDTGTTINEQPRVEVTLELHPEDRTPTQVTTKMLVSRVDPPRVGDRVDVAYRPDDPGTFAFRRARAAA